MTDTSIDALEIVPFPGNSMNEERYVPQAKEVEKQNVFRTPAQDKLEQEIKTSTTK